MVINFIGNCLLFDKNELYVFWNCILDRCKYVFLVLVKLFDIV